MGSQQTELVSVFSLDEGTVAYHKNKNIVTVSCSEELLLKQAVGEEATRILNGGWIGRFALTVGADSGSGQ